MRLIDCLRGDDDLSSFGTVLRFAALVYESADEGEANAPFIPNAFDGDIVFPADRAAADAAFDAWVITLREAEEQFLEEGDEGGFVALIESPKGLMILAGSNIGAYPNPDIDDLLPGAPRELGMPHVRWKRILADMFGE